MTEKRFRLGADFDGFNNIYDNERTIGCERTIYATKMVKLLNDLHEENLQLRAEKIQLKRENADLTFKNTQWKVFSEQSSYPFGSLLYLQAAAIPFKDIYFIKKEDSDKITIYVKLDYNKKEIEKFKEEHLPLGIEYEIFSIKEIKGDIKVIK